MEIEKELTIAQLAETADVTPRTIRYYISQGLLPSPGGKGQRRIYGYEHYLRLRLIKRLKEEHLPLAEIKLCLDALSLAEMEGLLSHTPEKPQVEDSPRDYAATFLEPTQGEPLLKHLIPHPKEGILASPQEADLWRRVTLAPGIELHYRPPLDPEQQASINRLIYQGVRLLGPREESIEEEQEENRGRIEL